MHVRDLWDKYRVKWLPHSIDRIYNIEMFNNTSAMQSCKNWILFSSSCHSFWWKKSWFLCLVFFFRIVSVEYMHLNVRIGFNHINYSIAVLINWTMELRCLYVESTNMFHFFFNQIKFYIFHRHHTKYASSDFNT